MTDHWSFVSGTTTVAEIIAEVEARCLALRVPPPRVRVLATALVEALDNIFRHAYQNAPGRPLALSLTAAADRVSVVLTDDGPEFDPRQAQLRDLNQLEEHGMGIHVMKALMTRLDYLRLPNGQNQLTMTLEY